MHDLPYQVEIETARERVRDAVRAFERTPSEANERRVAAAMEHWRDTKALRLAPRGSPGPLDVVGLRLVRRPRERSRI